MRIFTCLIGILIFCIPINAQLNDPKPLDSWETKAIKTNKVKSCTVTEYHLVGNKKSKGDYYEYFEYDLNGNLVKDLYGFTGSTDPFVKALTEYYYNPNQQLIREKWTNYKSEKEIDDIYWTQYIYNEYGQLIEKWEMDSTNQLSEEFASTIYTYRNDTLLYQDDINHYSFEYKGDTLFKKFRYTGKILDIYIDEKKIYSNANQGYNTRYIYNNDGQMIQLISYQHTEIQFTITYTYQDGLLQQTSTIWANESSERVEEYSYTYYK